MTTSPTPPPAAQPGPAVPLSFAQATALVTCCVLPSTPVLVHRVGDLHLTASTRGLVVRVTAAANGDCLSPWDATVEAGDLSRVAAQFGADVSVDAKGGRLLLRDAIGSASIRESTRGLLPPVVPGSLRSQASFDGPTLRTALAAARSHAANADHRYGLNVVSMAAEAGGGRFVGVDGNRLCSVVVPNEGLFFDLPPKKLPGVAFVDAVLLDTCAGPATLAVSDTAIAYESAGLRVVAILETVDFPDYRAVLPREFSLRVEVATAELVAATSRLQSLHFGDCTPCTRWDIGVDTVRMSSGNLDVRCDVVIAATIAGEPRSTGLNPQFVLDAMHALGGDRVLFEFGPSLSPIRVSADGRDDGMFVILMPVRLD